MGIMISPNYSICFYLHTEDFMLGDPSNIENPFKCEKYNLTFKAMQTMILIYLSLQYVILVIH